MAALQQDMPVADAMEQRLVEWASWLRNGKQAGGGWPTKNVLHESWLPPAPGARLDARPVTVASDARERELHAAITQLSVRLANTLVVVYLMRVPAGERAQALACKPSTVKARVAEAKRVLLAVVKR